MRAIEMTRQEAEDLVDLLECNDTGRPDRTDMANSIRLRWDMCSAGEDVKLDFRLGDNVSKVGGDYRFDGTVVAVFRKLSGVVRFVVEDDRGVLHIYSAKNLKKQEAK